MRIEPRVDREQLASDACGAVGGQEGDHFADFPGFEPAVHGNHVVEDRLQQRLDGGPGLLSHEAPDAGNNVAASDVTSLHVTAAGE
jgi:hypothetical protein